MSALGDLFILVASCFVATLFWATRQKMGRAVDGTRLISIGLFIMAVSAGVDAADLVMSGDSALTESLAYTGYALASVFLILGFVRWLPLLAKLDREVSGRARAEAEYQAALERSRRFNAGLEALGKAHMDEGWDRKTLCEETARRLSTLIGCDRVSIWRLDDAGSAIRCITLFDASSGVHEEGAQLERALNPDYFKAIESGGVVCVSDALEDPVTRAFRPSYLEPLGIGAMLDAPIRTGRGVHGVVCCEHVGPSRRWSPEEVSLVSAAAQYVAVAYLADNAETLASELKRALRDAQAASAAKSAFVANMSHGLRTPLNGVLGMARALSDEVVDPDQVEKVDVITRSGELLLGVLNDVLDLSKIEAGRIELRPEPVAPEELIQQTCALFQAAARQKDLDLSCQLQALPDRVALDGVRLRQILSNLVANAVKFTERGSVTIAARAEPESDGWRLVIDVCDTGCGITAEDQGRLFERFSQVDDSHSRAHAGTGLGLVIARELARRMGGDITLDSTPGRGSKFTVSVQAAAAEAEGLQDIDDQARDLSGLNVLLVDDNEVNRVVARCFVEPAGAVVVEAASGREALSLLEKQAFDLILLDAHMPGMSGLEVLSELRARPDRAHIPVIALTADALPGDKSRYLAAGMDAYVAKPVDKKTLLEACAQLAAGRSADQQSPARRA